MNFSKRTKKKILKMVIKTFTIMNLLSLMFWISCLDGIVSWQPWLIIAFNFGWLILVAYVNGGLYDTKPYHDRMKKEGDFY